MRCFAPALLPLVAAVAAAQTPVSRCYAACERNVADARAKASACGACLTSPDRPDAWLARLPATPPGLLADPDWEVRWAGLLAQARQRKSTAPRELTQWVLKAERDELVRACVTAVHAAGALRQSLGTLLASAPAAERCEGGLGRVREALWVELYAEAAPTRVEALRHLAVATGRAPARVVLDALPGHPATFDPMILDALGSWAVEADVSPAAELLREATPADVEAMNRVLAIYSQRKTAAAVRLTSTDVEARRQALSELGALAPLSAAELRVGLADEVAAHRLKAARALARGERRTLAEAFVARLEGREPSTEAELSALLALLDDVTAQGCAEAALRLWRDQARLPALRAQALRVAASCDFAAAEPSVNEALASRLVADRAAGLTALGRSPRREPAQAQLTLALEDADPQVRRAACEAAGLMRWRPGLERLTARLGDSDSAVRAEALRTLTALDAPGIEARLTTALERDATPLVRKTAAELLGRFAGPRVLSAIERASRLDPDEGVKLVAAQTLRRLRPGSSLP